MWLGQRKVPRIQQTEGRIWLQLHLGPNSAAAAAGQGFFKNPSSYEVGDTITTAFVPLVKSRIVTFRRGCVEGDPNDDGKNLQI
ncbi:hypothetical protein Ct9H90mP29_22340 [bacterium]|nr:MAG: hypothetical protein Ct9H90mP29_22340 [bacterium]